MAEGSPQFRPDTTKSSSIMILNGTTWGSFACYNATDTNRLYIRINDPVNEKIYFGIGQRSTNTDWYFRIKNPNGTIISGPTLLPKTAGSQGFISYFKQAIQGPSVVNPQGYNGFVFTPTAGLPGNYYIEFNQGSGTNITTNAEIDFGIFDLTVVNTSSNAIIPGRLFSPNWSFNTSSYSNQFFGSFYIYGSDSSVTRVNMNGIKPYKFRASCNSWGCTNTGNATNDRKSRTGFYVPAELKLFLQDPDHIAFPSGSMQFLNAPISFSRCIRDSVCINVNLTKKSDVTILIDQNGNGVFDPATADRKLIFPATPQGQNCLFWDGKNGLGAYVAPGSTLSAIINVENGEVNFPMFDVENHETGFSMSVIRPGAGLFVDSLYYNDQLVGGTTNLTGCAFPCHTWISTPVNTENSIGNNNTMNTWWFAHKQNVTSSLSVPDYLVTNAGADQSVCISGTGQDTIQLNGTIAFSTSAYNGSKRWTGTGSGSFYPNDSSLNARYIPSVADVSAGSVTLFLAPRYECTSPRDTVEITLKRKPQLATSVSPVNCFGQLTGTINLTVSNSNSPFIFNWSNGSSLQQLSNSAAGTYTVTVTSALGCTSTTSAVITQPSAILTGSVSSANPVACFGGSNGSISLAVNGGTSPYSYQWNNGATTMNITGLQAGNYTATITDNNGCTKQLSAIQVSEPAAGLDAAVSSRTDVLCTGGTNGAISLAVIGGTSPYQFLWNNGSTTQNITNLGAGNYSVIITDANGCTSIENGISVSQPSNSLTASAGNTDHVDCYGSSTGSINLSVNGGTTPYTYNWSNGANSQDLNNIPAGTYTVTVTDGHGCTFISSSITVTQPTQPMSGTATAVSQVSCNSGANGAISLSVNGGTPGYNYYWSNGSWNQNISGLYAGTYVVTITDNNGCTATAAATISQPAGSLNSTLSVTQQVLCHAGNNGAINLSSTGGTPPYFYQWNNGSTAEDISNLSAGSYTVTVTDQNGCINVSTALLSEPVASLSAGITIQSAVSCHNGNNGAIDLTAAGGTFPYTYLWNTGGQMEDPTGLPAGSYTVTVTDANGCSISQNGITVSQPLAALNASVFATGNVSCYSGSNGSLALSTSGGTAPYSYNWSNGGTGSSISQLSAGSYSVLVTDANGCTMTLGGLTVNQPPGALAVSAGSVTPVSCHGETSGSISLSVSGGTSGYSYLWNNGATSQQISGLSAGLYTATVTDAQGCTEVTNAISISQPAASLQTSVSGLSNVSCNSGNNAWINLAVTGGTSPYSFNWSNGASLQNLSNITAGSYTATVTDANGCTTTSNAISIAQPSAALSGNVVSASAVSCHGGNSGSINLIVAGGTLPYTFAWSNGALSQNISSLVAGSYTVTISDANNCTTSLAGITINQPAAALNASVSSLTNAGCFGANTGSISLTTSGGTAPYMYLWSNGASSQNISALAAGAYSATITDSQGCIHQINAIAVDEPAAPLLASVSSLSDISCHGGTNGSIDLSVSGGTSPYAFLWSNGATTQSLTNIAAGNFLVTVSDANGCMHSLSAIQVTQPANPVQAAASTITPVNCFGAASGAIDLSVSGGTPPFVYSWSNGAQSQDLTNVPAGSYTVTVTDNNGCSIITPAILVNQPPVPLSGSATTTSNVSCNSGANGAIQLSVNGGTPPYSFLWSNGATTQDISGLYAGNYAVTITDANTCTTNTVAAINQPPGSLNTVISVNQQVLCFAGNNGAIDLTPSGGTPPYNFQWSNGESTEDISGLQAGTYSVIVIDNNGCINVSSALVSQPAASLSTVLTTQSAVSCFGGNNGSVDLTANGGTAPYSYLWSNGSSSEDQQALAAGSYTVTVTDYNGCSVSHSAISVSQPPAALQASIASTIAVSCFSGNNGSISLNVSGGTPPYAYSWSNGSNASSISLLSAGSYDVTITDANGCITALNNLIVSQPADPLALNTSSVSAVSCFGGNNGSIFLSVSGGTAAYSFLWSNGATTQQISSLTSGQYAVTVTDANGCSDQVSAISITQPGAALSSGVAAIGNVDCNSGTNGSIQLTVAGGTAPYSYLWSNGASTQQNVNLPTGSYTVTVTDANGCTTINQAIAVTQPPAALSATTSSVSPVSCFGGNNGGINLAVSGGTAPYSFIWSNGAQSQNIANLTSGSFTVTITDANNCSASIAGIAINQPVAALQSSVSSLTPVGCFGYNTGAISLSVSGGTAPYAYAWSNGASTQNLSSIASGTYHVTITDINGCMASISAITIAQPSAAIQAAMNSTTPVACHGNNSGAIVLSVNGGTAPYAFNWSNGSSSQNLSAVPAGSYSVSISDANGCTFSLQGLTIAQPAAVLANAVSASSDVSCFGGSNGAINLVTSGGTPPYSFIWNNGSQQQSLVNVPAGSYAVTVTDDNGCTDAIGAITIAQPPAALFGSALTTQNVSCNSGGNGTVVLNINGGTAPYAYLWSNAATTQNISGLYSGTYVVTVTDANGCLFNTSAAVSQPQGALSSSISVAQQVDCFSNLSGAISLLPSGGTPPYSFLWNNGATTQNINNLGAGVYAATITDNNGCINNASVQVTQPSAPLSGNVNNATNVDCFGAANGSIVLSANGGTAPYLYLWSNGQSTQNLASLSPGTYTVTVTDANGCSAIVPSIIIAQPAAPLSGAVASNTPVDCFGGMNGTLTFTANGGTAPYNYLWSNGANTPGITNLMAGSYDITVTDANGCITQVNGIAVNQPAAALNASISSINAVSCFGGNNGAVNLNTTGGTSPYSYLWNTGDTLSSIANLDTGTYSVVVTDINGCSTSLSGIVIAQPPAPLASTTSILQQVDCFGGLNGAIDLTVSGGTNPYAFLWNNGDTSEDAANLASGTYTVTITDANGCTGTATAKIGQPDTVLTANISSVTDVACYGELTGFINITVKGGTFPYVYLWSNGMTTKSISGLAAGTYSVTVTDSKGCSFALSVSVNQPLAALDVPIQVTQQVLCYGSPAGAIDLQPLNGTPPYAFNWSNGDTTEDLNGVTAGAYTVTVTDANGCTFVASALISQPAGALSPVATISHPIDCHNNANGAIDLTVTYGTPPYTYLWSTGSTNQDITALASGIYSVTVTDANGCTASVLVNLAQPSAGLSVTGNTTTANCLLGIGGTITTSASGGTSPYSFNWSNGATSQNLGNLMAGAYSVIITDANGCSSSSAFLVTDNSVFHADAQGPSEVCIGDLVTLVADSLQGVSYQWYQNGQPVNGANSFTFTTPSSGSYTVIVSNACGTYSSEPITVTVHQVGPVTTSPNVIICPRDGESAQLYVYGGITYQWSPPLGLSYTDIYNPVAAPLQSTVYTVTITGDFGCKKTATIEVGVACDTLIIPTGFSPNSDGINDGYTIVGIENYPGNKIWIYNRWGNLIYKKHDYMNNWNGESNVAGIYIGKKVPPGTYFFILDLNNNSKPVQGFITLRY